MSTAVTGRVDAEGEMARSTYIYLVRSFEDHKVVGAFTVKHETVEWAVRNGWGPHNADLSRIRDGIHSDKTEVEIPWPTPENRA